MLALGRESVAKDGGKSSVCVCVGGGGGGGGGQKAGFLRRREPGQIVSLKLTSSPPCWMTGNKSFLISLFCLFI